MTVQTNDLDPFFGAEPEDLLWLDQLCEVNGYYCPQLLPRRRYAVLSPFMFTWGIVVGDLLDDCGYSDRWCFKSFADATKALNDWKRRAFSEEPDGAIRHV